MSEEIEMSESILSRVRESLILDFSYEQTYVVVTASDSFTIFTSQLPDSIIPVSVDYNVLRTQAVPSKKVIKRNRYVKLDTTNNPYGPWCLGCSDVHKVNNVYAGTRNGEQYASNNQVITRSHS